MLNLLSQGPGGIYVTEGTAGADFGTGVTELLLPLIQLLTVLVAVTADVVVTEIGLPVWEVPFQVN